MSQPQPSDKSPKDDFSAMANSAISDLSMKKSELAEKEQVITNMSSDYMSKMKDLSKINHELQDKVEFLLDLSATMNRKNDELKKANLELEAQKMHYNQMTRDLRDKLDQVLVKERELSIQRDFLARQVDKKTQDLIKAERFAVIGELATRLAHDLREPLATMKSTTDMMKLKPKMQIMQRLENFGKLDVAIQKITHQIDDVLNYVKMSELTLQQVSVLGLIDGIIDSTMIPSGIKISKTGTDVTINCDSKKIEAVVSNLISNASQAMNDKGEIKLRISDVGSNVQIEFEDTGPGIPPSTQPKIFEPLFTTKQNGTGLGLSICKNIVEQHGGSITVRSPPTVFTVRLPKNIAVKYPTKSTRTAQMSP